MIYPQIAVSIETAMTNHRVWGGDQFSDHDNPGCQRRRLHLHRSSTIETSPKVCFSAGKQMLNHGHSPFLGGDAKKEHTAKSWQVRQKQKGKGCWKNCNQRSFRRNFGTFLWCLQLFRSNPTRPSISAHLWVWTPIFEDILGQLLE